MTIWARKEIHAAKNKEGQKEKICISLAHWAQPLPLLPKK
jgi:hypothetical protein